MIAHEPNRESGQAAGAAPPPRRYAFLGAPYLGGVYSVYRSLRPALARHGLEVRWIGVGEHAAAVMRDPVWRSEHGRGEAIVGGGDEAATAASVCRHIEEAGYEGVFVNVRMRPMEMNLARYLPERIRRVMIVHSTQPGTYGPAASLRRFVHASVGVSPRIHHDLVRSYGFDPQTTFDIYNGVDPHEFLEPEGRGSGPLRLLFLGRVEDRQKGVFWLPKLMDRLADAPVRLTVAGEGPDLPELRRRCARLGDRVTFRGVLERGAVPAELAAHDVLLMPSRFEGLGLSLIEAMAAGCVPVASRLRGVTARVVTHGRDGWLVGVGDVEAMARHVRPLVRDAAAWRGMSLAARETARARFGLDAMGEAYRRVIELAAARPLPSRPLALEDWRYPRGFSSPLRCMLPERVKRWALERQWF